MASQMEFNWKVSCTCRNTDVCEDSRSIVINGIRTSHLKVDSEFMFQRLKSLLDLLTNHQSDGDESTFAVSRDQPHLPLKVHENSTSSQTAL